MRNKLIELIIDAKRTDPETGSFTEYLADHLIANGVTIQRWIPASEKPKEVGEYNVMIKGTPVSTTLFYSVYHEAWYEFSDDDFEQPYEITHWMPLPQPPKEKQNE